MSTNLDQPAVVSMLRRLADDIADRDRHMQEHTETLRATLGESLHREMRKHWETRHRLEELQNGIAWLCGYHSGRGTIPIDEIRALIEAVQR